MRPLGEVEGMPPVAGTGETSIKFEDTAKGCLTAIQFPGTPTKIKKWRKSNYAEPGLRVIHPGAFEDVKKIASDKYCTYGVSSADAEHIPRVDWIEHGRGVGTKSSAPDIKAELTEKDYRSSVMEPLGISRTRDYIGLPGKLKEPGFRYGKASEGANDNAKDLLYPHLTNPDTTYRKLYIKSHKSYEPGEQRKRDYEWDIDVKKYTFGRPRGDIAFNGVSTAVSAILHGEPDKPKKNLVNISQVSRQQSQDHLGKIKKLGNAVPQDPYHVYGKRSIRRGKNEWDAAACIQGKYSIAEQEPDGDLGKSLTPGFRNLTTEKRPFGIPSIRSDIPKYERKSIADNQNYGDDVNASYLLHPPMYASQGIEDEEFSKARNKSELLELLPAFTSEDLSPEEFDTVFDTAADGSTETSIVKFRNVLNPYLDMRKEKLATSRSRMSSVRAD